MLIEYSEACLREAIKQLKYKKGALKIGYDMRMKKQMKTRRSVTLTNDKSTQNFVKKKPAPPPTINIIIRMGVEAYRTQDPMLEVNITTAYIEKMQAGKFPPYVMVSTTSIIGYKHLKGMGMDMSSLHPTEVTLDCANSSANNAMVGIF